MYVALRRPPPLAAGFFEKRVNPTPKGIRFGAGLRGLGDYTAIANEIQTLEGWFPGSVSYRLNNPGNLTYAGQPGATPVTVGQNTFADFDSYADGYQALLNQIALNASRGQSISQFAAIYAPAADGNNPTSYAASLAAAVGLSPSDALSSADSSSASGDTLALPDLSTVTSSVDDSVTTFLDSFSDVGDASIFDSSFLPWLIGGGVALLAVWMVMQK
jgi:hypothetical protein